MDFMFPRLNRCTVAGRLQFPAKIAKLPELLRQRPNARVLSAPLLTSRYTLVHARHLTEDPARAPVLAPIFARLRGKGRNRSAYQAK